MAMTIRSLSTLRPPTRANSLQASRVRPVPGSRGKRRNFRSPWLALSLSLLCAAQPGFLKAQNSAAAPRPGSPDVAKTAPYFFHLRSPDRSAKPSELAAASLYFGKNDPGEDHFAVRIAGADCDLTVIYGMDFPMGRGPIGRKGQVHALDDEEARRFFPSMADKQISHPWIRIRGRMEKVARGSVLIAVVAGNIAQGELQLETASGKRFEGDFSLPIGSPP